MAGAAKLCACTRAKHQVILKSKSLRFGFSGIRLISSTPLVLEQKPSVTARVALSASRLTTQQWSPLKSGRIADDRAPRINVNVRRYGRGA